MPELKPAPARPASEGESESGVPERDARLRLRKAQSTDVARATASICNAAQVRYGGTSGHVGFALTLSAAAADTGRPAYQKFAVDVRASTIDGQGAFAVQAVPPRLKIGEIRGESISVQQARIRATRSERIMIVELSDKKAIDFSKSADPMRYTNHSCRPNARLCLRQGRVEFYALRAIEPGEEITVDYGQTHHEGKLRCRCGVAGCRGSL